MTDDDADLTQKTQPRKGRPLDIPVPNREDVAAAFERLAKASDPDDSKRSDARRAGK